MIQQQRPRRRPAQWRVRVYHNSLWARYKGAVYSALYEQSLDSPFDFSFVHIAESDIERVALGGVDLSYHQYPYQILFPGISVLTDQRRRALALSRDVLRNPTDLVIMSGYDRPENWLMLFTCMLVHRKRIVPCDSTIYDRPQRWLRGLAKRFFFRHCHGYIGYGQRSKDYLVSMGAREADITIPCQAAALPHDYDPAQVVAAYRRQGSYTDRPPHFLFLGRISPEKGIGDLLAAFSNVRNRIPGAHLDIVGAGPAEPEVRAQVEALSLAGCVTLHGPKSLSEIVPMFIESVALVLPSRSEPWGLVVNEALSYGCPAVVSNHCGCGPELVQPGVSGYTFETGNIEALAASLEAVRALSRDRLQTVQRCLDIMSNHTPQRAALHMMEACAHVLGVPRSVWSPAVP